MIHRTVTNQNHFLRILADKKKTLLPPDRYIMRHKGPYYTTYTALFGTNEQLTLNALKMPSCFGALPPVRKPDGTFFLNIINPETMLDQLYFKDDWQKVLDEVLPTAVHQRKAYNREGGKTGRTEVQESVDYTIARIPLTTDLARMAEDDGDEEGANQRQLMKCTLEVRPQTPQGLQTPGMYYPPPMPVRVPTKYPNFVFQIIIETELLFKQKPFEAELAKHELVVVDGELSITE